MSFLEEKEREKNAEAEREGKRKGKNGRGGYHDFGKEHSSNTFSIYTKHDFFLFYA